MRSKVLKILLIVVGILFAAAVVIALLARPAEDHPFFTEGPARPWVIAHQGGDGLWPGNTMFAFEQAAEMGVDVLEMDMHSTADGVLVLMHDATVERTTDGRGRINDLTLPELKELDAGYDWSPDEGQSYPFRGQGITVPTLEEVFTAFPDYHMNIEIKQAEPSIAQPFCQIIREYEMANKVLVASFNQAALDEFREVCPEIATSTGESEVITLFALNKLFLDALYSPAAQAIQIPEERSGLRILTQRFVDGSQSRNMEVHVWTVNEIEDMERILGTGVEGIITDRPDRLLELLRR